MKIQITVDAEEFWPSLDADIRSATDSVYVQTLSFEGDRAGRALASSLLSADAKDRRVIADEFYTKHRINDRLLRNPRNWFNSELRKERDSTVDMFAELDRRGVPVKMTNPSGPLALHALARNHKKLIAIDRRISYIGGVNFSEHNFAWHDMMLRIESEAIAQYLAEDFLATWQGTHLNASCRFDEVEIYRFDGRSNRIGFAPLLRRIASAKRSVSVISPYLTFPFCDALRTARKNGATVTLITPRFNNWPALQDYIIWEASRSGFEVLLYPERMMHLKAMLIDGEFLVAGSSNFDFLSNNFLQEIVAVITNRDAIQQFKYKVLEPDIAMSHPVDFGVPAWKGYYQLGRLKTVSALVRWVRCLMPRRLIDA